MNFNQKYPWQRFWFPVVKKEDTSLGVTGLRPLEEIFTYWDPELRKDEVTFEAIANTNCLLLTGDPGMGKSHALEATYITTDQNLKEHGHQTLWLNLNSYEAGESKRLLQDLFENPTYKSWQENQYQLHVFLDSFDECLLSIPKLVQLLINEFQKHPLERLYIRIACRPGERLSWIVDEFAKLYGNDKVEIYQLAPLKSSDVIRAAEIEKINSQAFWSEVTLRQVTPLAIRPITLKMLLALYKKDKTLPNSQFEIYEKGCLLLADETNTGRNLASRTDKLSVQQRLVVAGRIAVITLFTNQRTISWAATDWQSTDVGSLNLYQLAGSSEIINGFELKVTEAEIKEVLSSALFTNNETTRLQWAHQTYGEFLAAWYLLVHKQLGPERIMQLITSYSFDGTFQGLVPVLHETTAWLASKSPRIFSEVVKIEPDILLKSNVATDNLQDRSNLIDKLLESYDREEILDYDHKVRQSYYKLAHPGLANQLRPYIQDSSKGFVARRVATDIAEACSVRELQDVILALTLNSTELYPLRTNAAYALTRIADQSTKAALKPLVFNHAGDDLDDELKGCALKVTWPVYLNGEELFEALTPPQNESLFGSYNAFFTPTPRYNFLDYLQPNDYSFALQWLIKLIPDENLPIRFYEIMYEVLQRSWQYIEKTEIQVPFGRAVLLWLLHYHHFRGYLSTSLRFANFVKSEDNKKKQILFHTIIPILANPDNDLLLQYYAFSGFLDSEDIPWLLDFIETIPEQNTELRKTLAFLVKQIQKPKSEQSKQEIGQLESTFEGDLPEIRNQVYSLLDECEAGNSSAWWRINTELLFEDASSSSFNPMLELESDLRYLPGWKAADDDTRDRITTTAKRYLLDQDPEPSKWFGTTTLFRPAYAGYRALLLVLHQDPDHLNYLPATVWEKWAPIILFYRISTYGPESSTSREGEKSHYILVGLAYRFAPKAIVSNLLKLIELLNRPNGHLFILQKLKYCWDAQLLHELSTRLSANDLYPICTGELLKELILQKSQEAYDYAVGMIGRWSEASNEAEQEKILIIAATLLATADDAGWKVIWPILNSDASFGKQLILKINSASEGAIGNICTNVAESELGEFYLWLTKHYPQAGHPTNKIVYHQGLLEVIADWKEAIIKTLRYKGTGEACLTLQRLVDNIPDSYELKIAFIEARKLSLSLGWQPLKPDQILKFIDDISREKEVDNSTVQSKNNKGLTLNLQNPLRNESQYRLAVVTALPEEFAAVEAMLDKTFDFQIPGDPLHYTGGLINNHPVVIAVLPKMGNNISTSVSSNLLRSFPNVTNILMVGIAGGIPYPTKIDKHIRLGDIVISADKGVIQFDYGKLEQSESSSSENHFIIRDWAPPPSANLQQAVRRLQARSLRGERPWEQYIERANTMENFAKPNVTEDILYDSYDQDKILEHPSDPSRMKGQPKVHYGLIGSSNTLLKDPIKRDKLRDEQKIQAVEMEGSGIADATWIAGRAGYLLIRGICDYCDSHKNDDWHGYAAVVAAAYMRALIESLPDE